MSSLQTFIRPDQSFLIYIHNSQGNWIKYTPELHGDPKSIESDYLVAYMDGGIITNTARTYNLPKGVHYIETYPPSNERMPRCKTSHQGIRVVHEVTTYPRDYNYCTSVKNLGDVPFRVRRFASFHKAGFFKPYLISTISNHWFTAEDFILWYNQKDDWIKPGESAIDHDNFGFGQGYWVFDIEFNNGETLMLKSKLPEPAEVLRTH